jgi:hypothetical protein
MIQSIMFAAMLYLTPSVLLAALLVCRADFDREPGGSESDRLGIERGWR